MSESTQVKAGVKHLRMSAYKMREVAILIKGKPIDEARRILTFTPKQASRELAKVLESAIANAEHNFQIPQEELIVRVVSADEGTTIKRMRPRAQGRGFAIRKRTCHVNLVLERDTKRAVAKAPTPARRPRRAVAKPKAAPVETGETGPATQVEAQVEKGETDGS
ncbi:MAG: 50S ribosomal protein L22 [Actinomycetota bacterium]